MHRDTKTTVFFVALGKKHNRSVGKVPVNMHFFIHIIILINSTNALFLFCHVPDWLGTVLKGQTFLTVENVR